MSKTVGQLVGIRENPEPDGAHIITVRDFGGSPFDVVLSPEQMQAAVKLFQQSLAQSGLAADYPEMRITDATLAYSGTGVALMATTDQGAKVLVLEKPEAPLLRRLLSSIERALSFLEQPRN